MAKNVFGTKKLASQPVSDDISETRLQKNFGQFHWDISENSIQTTRVIKRRDRSTFNEAGI